jgi:alpha-1,6-mannosyltransferase
MIDRVANGTGRLGPVDDAAAMSANILEVWDGDRTAMGEAARAHALQFSWVSSMEALLGHVYPAAFERRRERLLALGGAAVAAA